MSMINTVGGVAFNVGGPQIVPQNNPADDDDDADWTDEDGDFRHSQLNQGPNEIGNVEDLPDYISHQQSVQMNMPFANVTNQPTLSRSPPVKMHPMKPRVG